MSLREQLARINPNEEGESVSCSHGVFDFQDMGFDHGFYQHWDSWTLGTGPDYYSEMVPRKQSTWDSSVIVLE